MSYYGSRASVLFGGPATPTIKTLIIINVAVFLLQTLEHLLGVSFLVPYFGLVPWRVTHEFFLWQFVTYMFLHGDPFHLFFNMLALYMFGNELERYWRRRGFLTYYFLTGIGAGVCSWVVGVNSATVIIGASGAIYGLLLAFAIIDPERIVLVSFLFPVKVKYLVLFMGFIASGNSKCITARYAARSRKKRTRAPPFTDCGFRIADWQIGIRSSKIHPKSEIERLTIR